MTEHNSIFSARLLKEGKGWRLGFDPGREIYRGLVGGENWALELTEAEFQDFCRLLSQLKTTIAVIATELMEEEKITLARGRRLSPGFFITLNAFARTLW
jgi:hypothetical protein